MRRLAVLLVLAACKRDTATPALDAPGAGTVGTAHSSSIAISADGATVYVVNADSDSVSVIDTHAAALTSEIALAPAPVVGGDDSFAPTVMPRALALSPGGATLYVSGERSGLLYAIDLASHAITSVAVGSEPIGVVVSSDSASIYVASSQDGTVARVRASDLSLVGKVTIGGEPWALAWSPSDGSLLATLFMGGVAAIDPNAMSLRATYAIPDTAPRTSADTAPDSDPRLAHGAVRGLYDIAARPPAGNELWVAHAMLGIDTAQPTLDFERTAFPSLSILDGAGTYEKTLSTDAQDVPGIDGSFADVVSGPHAIAFTSDGSLALVADTNSEDVLAVTTSGRVEAALARPIPGHMPEGIVIAPGDEIAYLDERNTGDVAVVHITHTTTGGITLSVDAPPIKRITTDPMPTEMRLGQHLFYSANSDELPLTKNHWIACATCHMEGRSDAVTWDFGQGPRDTPSNAGGMLGTGFLFRTADRNQVQDYWHTINVEQGGTFDPIAQATLLNTLTNYVNFGIPLPVPPTTDAAMVAAGAVIFARADVGCSGCHSGPRFTDSGTGNPTLDYTRPICDDAVTTCAPNSVILHDVGTCNTGAYPDVAHFAVDGITMRPSCMFDAPSLSGLASSPPYLHDGSAATIHDLLEQTRGTMGHVDVLSADEEAALVEYLRSL